jgi:Asp-tRNA(Asn)/Glu-tRNA(Gln) amidotransferase A subunit family amidase
VGAPPAAQRREGAPGIPLALSLDVTGPMASSVQDVAPALTVMAGTDGDDAATAEADAQKRSHDSFRDRIDVGNTTHQVQRSWQSLHTSHTVIVDNLAGSNAGLARAEGR